ESAPASSRNQTAPARDPADSATHGCANPPPGWAAPDQPATAESEAASPPPASNCAPSRPGPYPSQSRRRWPPPQFANKLRYSRQGPAHAAAAPAAGPRAQTPASGYGLLPSSGLRSRDTCSTANHVHPASVFSAEHAAASNCGARLPLQPRAFAATSLSPQPRPTACSAFQINTATQPATETARAIAAPRSRGDTNRRARTRPA